MFKWLKDRSEKKKEARLREKYKAIYARDPNLPISFGYNNYWLAVKANTAEQVCEQLSIDLEQTCNWIEGKIKALEGHVFITPSINGWVFYSKQTSLGLLAYSFEGILR